MHMQTQMLWPLAVAHVTLISVTLVIRSVSILLTSAAQQCAQILMLIISMCQTRPARYPCMCACRDILLLGTN